eukprot:5117932-Heterocapsa_arctica.AAC.1
MPDHSGTRVNKLKRDNMFVNGALSGLTGTKIEIFTQILGMDNKIFSSVGPYTPPQQPPQQRYPEEQGTSTAEPYSSWGRYRSRSNDQRGRGGR